MSLPQLLVGKVAAITGGLTGIGKVCDPPYFPLYQVHANSLFQAIAIDYLRHGAKVAINHLGGPNEDALLQTMREDVIKITGPEVNRFIAVAGDVTNPDTGRDFIGKTVDAFGRLDVFVNNAGVCKFEEFLE